MTIPNTRSLDPGSYKTYHIGYIRLLTYPWTVVKNQPDEMKWVKCFEESLSSPTRILLKNEMCKMDKLGLKSDSWLKALRHLCLNEVRTSSFRGCCAPTCHWYGCMIDTRICQVFLLVLFFIGLDEYRLFITCCWNQIPGKSKDWAIPHIILANLW